MSFNRLFTAFDAAFEDYEIQLSRQELNVMLHRRGFVPELSFGAFEKDKLVAFTLNGIGLFNGVKTAYDTGTGTLKDARGQGLATKIFGHSLPFLKKAGVSRYVLEVLQHNTGAVSLYQSLGFIINREFNYFTAKTDQIRFQSGTIPAGYTLQPMDRFPEKSMSGCHDFPPSWQNSFEAILRAPDDFKCIGAYTGSSLSGFCIIEPGSGDITQIAVNKAYRRKGIGSALLEYALTLNQCDAVKVVNTEPGCPSITAFLENAGIPLKGRQFEMIRHI